MVIMVYQQTKSLDGFRQLTTDRFDVVTIIRPRLLDKAMETERCKRKENGPFFASNWLAEEVDQLADERISFKAQG